MIAKIKRNLYDEMQRIKRKHATEFSKGIIEGLTRARIIIDIEEVEAKQQ